MEITRNGQTVEFRENEHGDLVQESDYLSRANIVMPTQNFILGERVIVAANLSLARQVEREWKAAHAICKGTEVINNGRPAVVTLTTRLNMHGPMAELLYTDTDETGMAMISDLVRADEIADLLPATTYTTVRVDAQGKRLTGEPERKYRATTAHKAARFAARAIISGGEYDTASVAQVSDDTWAFTPHTGATVRIHVIEPDADTEPADSGKREAIEALFGAAPAPRQVCPRCAGTNGNHGLVHVRHGNGGGHNEPCPNAPEAVLIEGTEGDAFDMHAVPESVRSEYDGDVVARSEELHPGTHPYRVNEDVLYVGPTGVGSWMHGPMYFLRMVEMGTAEIMTMSGPVNVEVADLRRTPANVAVEMTPADLNRIFQALAQDARRLELLNGIEDAHTVELCNRFAALGH